MKRAVFILCLFAFARLAEAAPCCGGTANVPSLISGDDRSQITATLTTASIVADAPVGGGVQYRGDTDRERAQTLRIDGATLLSDRLQAGVTLPIVRRSRSRNNNDVDATGLGDLSATLGYELLPEWSYTSWRPKGIVFLTGTFPTGGSIYDATERYRIDSRGRGFYSVSAGTFLMKHWGNWDTSLLLEGHRSFSRTVVNEVGTLGLNPGWGTSGMLALGLSPGGGSFRLGLALAPSFEEAVATDGLVAGRGEGIALWTAAAQASYLVDDQLSLSLSYSDQTLIRASDNTALQRSFAFLVQKRFER